MKNQTENEKTFGFESPLAGSDLIKKEEKRPKTLWDELADLGYSPSEIILDQEEGWIFERKRGGKKGNKIRKLYERLDRGWGDDGITFWRPRLKDIVACEAKRWKAKQYYANQIKKVMPAFDLVLENVPFCCIRKTKDWPGFAWIEFPKNEAYPGESRGVSWDWWDTNSWRNKGKPKLERPDSPLKQEVGDAWFQYETRSRQLRERLGFFETLFHRAISEKYAQAFYRERYSRTMINLVINGRNYLIGMKDGREFGVIAYPEEVITQVLK